MLEIKNLTKIYRTRGGEDVRALDDVTLSFEDTGMVFLLGKSGSGKSTLLNLIGGLDRPDGGEIIVKGRGSKTFSTSDFDSYRNTFVGFIFQEYNILNEFTVEDNIAIALELQGKPKDKAKIAEILRSVEMEQYAKRKPNTLSGGQKQRIAIARALVKEPEIIMADEPTGALDSATGKQVFDTLKKLSETKLVIVVSHDREFAEIYGDRIIELKDGKVIADISKRKIAAQTESTNVSYIGDNTISVKSGSKLTPQDIKKIEKFIMSAPNDVLISNDGNDISAFKKQARIDENGAREQFFATKTEEIEVKKYAPEDSRFIRSKLPLRHAIKIGASSMKVKPFRLFFTILLTFVAFVMFGLFSTLMLFNEQQTIAESLMMSTDEYVLARKSYNYVRNQYYNGELEYSYNGYDNAGFKQKDAEDIWKNVDGDAAFAFNYLDTASYYSDDIFRIKNVDSVTSNVYNTSIAAFAVTSENSKFRSDYVLWGNYPESTDEIMISDYTFNALKKCQKVYVPTAGGADREVTVTDYVNLRDVVLVLYNNYNGEEATFSVSGVYKSQTIPDKYLDDNADSDVKYEWQSEYSGGFYGYALVSDDFYDEYKDTFTSDYGGGYKVEDYFEYLEEWAELSSLTSINYIYAISSLPVREGLTPYTVYGLDGKQIDSLSDNGIAVNAYMFYDLLNPSIYNYVNNDYDANAEWFNAEEGELSLDGKLTAFSYGKSYNGNATVSVTTAERLEYLADVMAFVKKYEIPVMDDIELGKEGGVSAVSVSVEGFYIDDANFGYYIYAGNSIYNKFEKRQPDPWKDEMITKYDSTGDKYSKAIFIKDDGIVNEVISRSVNPAADDSFYTITNSVISKLSIFTSLIEVLSQVFLYVGIGFALFSMLLLFNFISVSIVNKKKEIGILRAVGARSADVFKIFYAETVIITGICLILSVIVSFLLCSVFNNLIAAELGLTLALFVFKPISVLIMIGIAVVTSVISTFMPVYSIAKKRPVESIRAL